MAKIKCDGNNNNTVEKKVLLAKPCNMAPGGVILVLCLTIKESPVTGVRQSVKFASKIDSQKH